MHFFGYYENEQFKISHENKKGVYLKGYLKESKNKEQLLITLDTTIQKNKSYCVSNVKEVFNKEVTNTMCFNSYSYMYYK